MQNKKDKQQIYITALSKAVLDCLGSIPPSRIACESGISTSTMSNLVNAKKNFNITTIVEVAEAIGVKATYLLEITENYLPEDFTFLDL